MNQSPANSNSRSTTIVCMVILSAAVTGFFVGLSGPMQSPDQVPDALQGAAVAMVLPSSALPATDYTNIDASRQGPNSEWGTHLSMLKQIPYDPFAEVALNPDEKLASLVSRQALRAFNGAPPTVPHPIDQMSSRACLACHAEGARTESMRIAKMSHPPYASCTQCHVEKPTSDTVSDFRENQFVGLPAPFEGPKAYLGAPPQVPHSTWMRDNCLSCHGFTGSPGLQTTHPWRQNCLQCHAHASQLDQVLLPGQPNFLPPIPLKDPLP